MVVTLPLVSASRCHLFLSSISRRLDPSYFLVDNFNSFNNNLLDIYVRLSDLNGILTFVRFLFSAYVLKDLGGVIGFYLRVLYCGFPVRAEGRLPGESCVYLSGLHFQII